MYNSLADFVVYQDQAFLLQTLCLMLKKTDSEMQKIFESAIDLGQFYTFDNDWTFYKFKKLQDVKFDVADNLFQSHILNYIAELDEVKDFVQKVNHKIEELVPPGPWVITVDYKARSKAKTHFIVVKAT